MKKRLFFLLVINISTIVIILSGCSKNRLSSENTLESISETQEIIINDLGNQIFPDSFSGRVGIVSYEKRGMLFHDENYLLNYFDASKKESVVLCNKSNCEHKFDPRKPELTECSAAFSEGILFLLGEKKIYIIESNTLVDNKFIAKIYEQNPDGTNRKILSTAEGIENIRSASLYGNRIIMTYSNSIDLSNLVDGMMYEELDEKETGILIFDIESKSVTKVAVPYYKEDGGDEVTLYVRDMNMTYFSENNIAFATNYCVKKEGEIVDSIDRYFNYEIQDKKLTKIYERKTEFVGPNPLITKEGILDYNPADNSINLTSFNGDKEKIISVSFEPCNLYSIEGKIFVEEYNTANKVKTVYEIEKNKLKKIFEHSGGSFDVITTGYVWFSKNSDTHSRISVEDFINGKISGFEEIKIK